MAKSKLKPLESTTANLVLGQMKNVDTGEQMENKADYSTDEDMQSHKREKATTKKRIGLNIVITPEQNLALDILAKYRDVSKTQLLRDLVDKEISENKEKINRYKEFFGMT